MNIENLINKTCKACSGDSEALTQPQSVELLKSLNGWVIDKDNKLHKAFTFKNFVEAMDFAYKITIIAEQEGHHPDLYIAWGLCKVFIWTHKVNELTEDDFILASKIG